MLVMFLSAALFVSGAATAITPTGVERMIDRYGAKATVNKLANAPPNDTRSIFGDYDKVLEGVSSGDARWLALLPRLDPGTDAGSAEFLRIAVAEALPKNPAGVLRFTSRLSWFRDACGYPMIEPTNREMRAYFKAAIPALKAFHDPALERAKRICLTQLIKAQRAHADTQPLEKMFTPNAPVCVRFDAKGHVVGVAVDGRADVPDVNAAMLKLLQSRAWSAPSKELVGKWIAMSVAPDGSPVPELLPDCSRLAVSP